MTPPCAATSSTGKPARPDRPHPDYVRLHPLAESVSLSQRMFCFQRKLAAMGHSYPVLLGIGLMGLAIALFLLVGNSIPALAGPPLALTPPTAEPPTPTPVPPTNTPVPPIDTPVPPTDTPVPPSPPPTDTPFPTAVSPAHQTATPVPTALEPTAIPLPPETLPETGGTPARNGGILWLALVSCAALLVGLFLRRQHRA